MNSEQEKEWLLSLKAGDPVVVHSSGFDHTWTPAVVARTTRHRIFIVGPCGGEFNRKNGVMWRGAYLRHPDDPEIIKHLSEQRDRLEALNLRHEISNLYRTATLEQLRAVHKILAAERAAETGE